MALILNIETATTNCSVSLSKDGETIVLKEDYNNKFSHAETLHIYIDSLFKSSNLQPTDIDAVAVSKGPGSYTGLRIGVSAAKGLCIALNKPLIAIPTLESLAHQVKIKDGLIVSMLDARRNEVYCTVYDAKHQIVQETQAHILSTESYKTFLDQGTVHFIGSGVNKTKDIIYNKSAYFIEAKLPSADDMGKLSEIKYKNKAFEDVAYFEPYYLKDFIAIKSKK
ncbi:MAG: tRNA (adenosine(37)-N6)-threonylcarbamoyltransferase complex dimerization subunit type 1 TsaB [Winogradskyella sp.]|nr:tRNA (adenosine(37)-N6)-threonylcarbamoyltransferase complex dimerization subunit type 1 TsaB [Winogradskyella sp.]